MQQNQARNDNRRSWSAWRRVIRRLANALQDLGRRLRGPNTVSVTGHDASALQERSALARQAGRLLPPPPPCNDDALSRREGAAARVVALALQGGGAHGAFTWGVLDRLLEEPNLAIEAISGTSAGALNAAALAAGHIEAGPEGARRKLEELWRRVSRLSRLSPWRGTPFHMMVDIVSRVASPYQLNPLGLDPLSDILVNLIDFESLRRPESIRLLLAATNIASGEARLFSNEELSAEVLLASACLPALKQAVKLDDGYYWDGGFTANPPLLPLIERSAAREILLVRVDPERQDTLPTTVRDIQARVSRIVFNAPLKAELDRIEGIRGIVAEAGPAAGPRGRRVAEAEIHMLGADEHMRGLDLSSKLNLDWAFLSRLKEVGRATADRWLSGENLSAELDNRARDLTPAV